MDVAARLGWIEGHAILLLYQVYAAYITDLQTVVPGSFYDQIFLTLMTDSKRMVAVSIGVSDAEKLPFLAGALNCADQFFQWATASGYEARLITDEDEPVTMVRLRREFDTVLADTRPIHRLLVYFAGHGMIRELESGLWFLSDWKQEGLVVAYEALRRRLATYGVRQIAIFSDACRSLPKSVRDLLLEERAVLGLGAARGEPDLDKFVAVQDGEQAFAVPGATPADDVCVFSGVLLEALWGSQPDAFSKVASGRITSSSLGTYLKGRVPEVARSYGLTLKPVISPAFPEDDNVYFTTGSLAGGGSTFVWPPPPGPSLGLAPPPVEKDPVAAAAEPATTFRKRSRVQFETRSGFAVEGAPIRRLWTPRRVHAEPHGNANWWRVREENDIRLIDSAPILIEFADDRFAALTALPDFITELVCDSRGVSSVAYRRANRTGDARITEDTIEELERGALRADAVTHLATLIRFGKHDDPMLGVFAAYLYDSIGDTSSIRQMAYFYVKRRQPIPFDIALLADIPIQPQEDFLLARVPPVAKRTPRSEAERQNPWTYDKTPAADGVVGGAWPWLRQGWAFLTDPTENESTLIRPELAGFAKHLTASRFTTLDPKGGLELALLFGLVPRDPPQS